MYLAIPARDMDSEELKAVRRVTTASNVRLFVTASSAEENDVSVVDLMGEQTAAANAELLEAQGDAFCGSPIWAAYYRKLCVDSMLIKEYDFYIFSRIEYNYLSEHVGLKYLSTSKITSNSPYSIGWIPDGEDYGGVGDRHFVTQSFEAFQAFMGLWQQVIDGRALQLFKTYRHVMPYWQIHDYLRLLLNSEGVFIDRFPAFGHLVCVHRETSTSSRLKNAMYRDDHSWDICSKHVSDYSNYGCVKDEHGPLARVKYISEFYLASQVANCVDEKSWNTSLDNTITDCFCNFRHPNSFYGNMFIQFALPTDNLCTPNHTDQEAHPQAA
jgi:hypothetical protein